MATDRKLTPRGRERRRQLLDFATKRFAEHGYHPTSVADIVNGVGVGKGVFYWYFDSKEELFVELLSEAQRALRRTQRDAIADETDPLKRIELGIRAGFRWWAEHPEIMNLLQFAATEKQFRPALRHGQQVLMGDLLVHLKEAIAQGKVRDTDPDLLANAVLGLTGQLTRELVHRRGDDPDAVADLAVQLILHGITG